jgi:ElaB/YqjD/DUF883 family membrane-anchored ribosome-binding protein
MTESSRDDTGATDVTPPAEPAQSDDPDRLREEIGQTRAELGETVEALSEKADVKAQVSDKVDEQKQRAEQAASEVRDKLTGAGQKVSDASPEDLKQAGVAAKARVESSPLPATAGAFVLGLMVGRLTKRS